MVEFLQAFIFTDQWNSTCTVTKSFLNKVTEKLKMPKWMVMAVNKRNVRCLSIESYPPSD